MPRFDEYVKSNETPKNLCDEIDSLKEQIEALTNINVKAQAIIAEQKEQIEKMKCCWNCNRTRKAKCDDDLRVLATIRRRCESWELAE